MIAETASFFVSEQLKMLHFCSLNLSITGGMFVASISIENKN